MPLPRNFLSIVANGPLGEYRKQSVSLSRNDPRICEVLIPRKNEICVLTRVLPGSHVPPRRSYALSRTCMSVAEFLSMAICSLVINKALFNSVLKAFTQVAEEVSDGRKPNTIRISLQWGNFRTPRCASH